ncbi:MAG: cobalamin biosynthesis protein P47K [Mariniblastus sp.]|nr:cobalamin biosynthesis protein P47K [Mariniblastus sp.]
MQSTPRFIMIGGFLGAGKTTTVSRLAQHYQEQGQNVIIVTNDQATDLVDTNILRSQGYRVGEVAGSCFCCNFNELTATVERLGDSQRPDVILAEPVGSCTDLVATVIRPLQEIYSEPLEIAPYGVIVKPSHGSRILGRQKKGGFSPQAEYIFRKQLEEADFVIINRIDELLPEEVAYLSRLVGEHFDERPVVEISAKTGAGFENFCAFLGQRGDFGRRLMDVDYDVYAEGEAQLGWLNCQLDLTASEPFDLDAYLLSLLNELKDDFAERDSETAHLKAIGMSDGYYAVANLVSSQNDPQLSLPSHCKTRTANVVVNARVAIDPECLTELTRNAIQLMAVPIGADAHITTLQSFRPGRPVPTHRIASSD